MTTKKTEDLQEHFSRMLELLDIEREAEKEENKRELDRWPVEVREAQGKTVTRLTLERQDIGVGGLPLLVVSRAPAGEELAPFHAMDQGDLVRVVFGGGQLAVDGTLYEVDEYRAVVALNEPLMEAPRGTCEIDLLGSDATYQRMRRAIDRVRSAEGRLGQLRDILMGFKKPDAGNPAELSWFNPGLNAYQKEAVTVALSADDVALIHGPPGTGKTTVLVEIIRQAAARGQRVLASAPSNIAVDNMLEKLLDAGLRVVRVGHPARTLESLRHATLMAQVAERPERKLIDDLDRDREQKYIQLFRRQQRGHGLTWEEEKEMRKEIRRLWKEARSLERALSRQIVRDAQVLLATHAGINRDLTKEKFDLAVLDEASQATEPLSWVPIAQAAKVIIAGDPLQLPPTIYSQEAEKGGLGTTLMQRLMDIVPPNLTTLLRVQYRMHETLMGFSSAQFYENKLEAHESVKSHLAKELPGVAETPLTDRPFIYVDTAGTGYEEKWNELLDSRENEGEATLALRLWNELAEAGVRPSQTAIITPYAAQARLLKPQVPKGLEVGTVDGFQGREKEVVLLTLVRSNDKGEVGFLGDTRRMNVALTRARRLLIVIGDSATLARHPFYAAFLEHAEKSGTIRSAWEWK